MMALLLFGRLISDGSLFRGTRPTLFTSPRRRSSTTNRRNRSRSQLRLMAKTSNTPSNNTRAAALTYMAPHQAKDRLKWWPIWMKSSCWKTAPGAALRWRWPNSRSRLRSRTINLISEFLKRL